MRLELKVVPKSSRDRVVGWMGSRLKVQVSAAPERGRANAAVEAVLADLLGLPPSAVRVVAGHASPRKTVELDAADAWVRERLPKGQEPRTQDQGPRAKNQESRIREPGPGAKEQRPQGG